MSQQLTVFAFESRQVRTGGDPDNPWFVAKDVCDALGIANASDAVASLDDDDKGVAIADTPGGRQSVAVVYEGGVYDLVFRSRKKAAKAFKRWVKNEVLPAIRKQGVYVAPGQDRIIAVLDSLREVRLAEIELEKKTEVAKQLAAQAAGDASEAKRIANAALHTAESNYGYFTVLGYLRILGREADHQEAAHHGRKLAAICRQAGVDVHTTKDVRWGLVNTYPESVLESYFAHN